MCLDYPRELLHDDWHDLVWSSYQIGKDVSHIRVEPSVGEDLVSSRNTGAV